MLTSAPRGSFAALLVHTIPAADSTVGVYARILSHRPNIGTALDPLRDVQLNGGSIRVRFTPTARLRRTLRRFFAAYAFVEAAVMVSLGIYVLWSQYDVVYGEAAPCANPTSPGGLGSGSGAYPEDQAQPCGGGAVEPAPELAIDVGDHGDSQSRARQTAAADAEPYQYLSRGLVNGRALYVWAQANIIINTLLYWLNCAVGKYPLGADPEPANRASTQWR